MTSLNYQQFVTEVYRAYRAQEFEHALAMLDQHRPEYPEGANALYNMHYCVAALVGQKERALALIQEAVEAGLCWPATVLVDDPDLASLKEDPGFQAVVARSQALFDELVVASQPERVVITPPADAPGPYPLLLVMHGRNGNAVDTAAWWAPLAADGWLVAVAQSSQPNGSGAFVWDDPQRAEQEIADHYAQLKAAYALDEDRVVLGGFSQGAGLAIRMTLTDALPARGFLVVGPFVRDFEALEERLAGCDLSHKRGFLVTGALDEARDNFTRIEALLDSVTMSHRREDFPDIAHEYPANFETVARRGLDFLLAG